MLLRPVAAWENGTCRAGAPIGATSACYHPGASGTSEGAGTIVGVSSSNWVRPVILAVSCLILGFVAGWSLANVGGDSVALPDASVDVTVAQPAPGTTTVTPPEEQVPARPDLVLVVLNGTTRNGLAAQTATQLKALGYAKISVGTRSGATGPTVVYYREGQKAAAERLAKDLGVSTATPIAGTPLASAAPGSAQLVVLLGPG